MLQGLARASSRERPERPLQHEEGAQNPAGPGQTKSYRQYVRRCDVTNGWLRAAQAEHSPLRLTR